MIGPDLVHRLARFRSDYAPVFSNYEREEERRLVAATLDKVGAGGFAAAGVDSRPTWPGMS